MEGDTVNIDAMDILQHDPDLYSKMVQFPLETVPVFDMFLMSQAQERERYWDKVIEVRLLERICVHLLIINVPGFSMWLKRGLACGRTAIYVCTALTQQARIFNLKEVVKLRDLNPSGTANATSTGFCTTSSCQIGYLTNVACRHREDGVS